MDEIVTLTSRTECENQDGAISALLELLEADIRAGRRVHSLSEGLARAVLANSGHAVNVDDEIKGDVAL
jgi:antitoxin PrlF